MSATLTSVLVAYVGWRFGVWCGVKQEQHEREAPAPSRASIHQRRAELAGEAGRRAGRAAPSVEIEPDDDDEDQASGIVERPRVH